MNGPNPVGIIFWLGMMIWAFCILANKRRGFGYYLLAFLFTYRLNCCSVP